MSKVYNLHPFYFLMPIRIELLDYGKEGFGAVVQRDLEKVEGYPQGHETHYTGYAGQIESVVSRVQDYLDLMGVKETLRFEQVYWGSASGVSPRTEIDCANLLNRRGIQVNWDSLPVDKNSPQLMLVEPDSQTESL